MGGFILEIEVDAGQRRQVEFPQVGVGRTMLIGLDRGLIPVLCQRDGVGEGIWAAHADFSHEAWLCNSRTPVTFFLELAKRRKKITCGFRIAAKPRLRCNICHSGVDGSRAYE